MTQSRWMSYNIRLGMQQGLDAISKIITDANVDVVAIQEIGNRWTMGPSGDSTQKLSQLTGLSHFVHVPAIQRSPHHHYGHAVLSRWPIENYVMEILPQDEDEYRALLTSEIATPQGKVHLMSTHLSWRSGDRDPQGQLMVRRVKELVANKPGEPVVIMGDLNERSLDTPWFSEMRQMMSDADDAQKRLTFPASNPRRRIDYLLAAGASWEDVDVIHNATASDHFPVVATLKR